MVSCPSTACIPRGLACLAYRGLQGGEGHLGNVPGWAVRGWLDLVPGTL